MITPGFGTDFADGMPLAWIAAAIGARVIGDLPANGRAYGICTDTRRGVTGSLFFALQGENADGHAYVGKALETGAVAAVVSKPLETAAGPQLLVPDTLQALGDLAKRYRQQFDIPVIAITGSVGKTSTKEMTAAALRTRCCVLASEKNHNNEIGVPLTLLRLRRGRQAAIIEMGMRGPGEIDRLAEIAGPTIGIMTNIGYAHIERLGSREGIARAKAELLRRLPPGGAAILMESEFLGFLREQVPAGARVVVCGRGPGADVRFRAPGAEGGPAEVSAGGKKAALSLKAVGAHHLSNAVLALAAAAELKVPLAEAAEALGRWEGAEGRMEVRKGRSEATVLDDCYNAGPESMESALQTLRQRAGQGRGVAVLGDMRELGAFSAELHRGLGRHVIDAGPRLLVTVGAAAAEIALAAQACADQRGAPMPDTRQFAGTMEAAEAIAGLVRPGETVLVKGSRALEMERIVAALTGDAARSHHD